jgi:uncharacterized damage-inducible protein DinB
MAISAALLPEFDMEMATARKVIERLPEDKYNWAPHDRSMKAGRLASHIAEMPAWGTHGITMDSLDVAPVGGPQYEALNASSKAQLLAAFDKNVADCRAAIAGASDEDLMKSWSLKRAGQTLMTMPKIAVVRTFVMNHVIHHRGQLSVYLRMANVPVPSIYGPSADEGQMGAGA